MGIFDKIKSIEKLNEDALKYIDKTDCSWHDTYKNSSYIYIGNLDTHVTEGDIIVMFSQFGEPIDINLVRDEETGESKGYCFLAYADQRSTILAVDNFIGYKLLDRPLVVDHVLNYRLPKKYTNNENNDAKEEYKPSGAEGGGIGVYNILGGKQYSKDDSSHDNTEDAESLDEDELRASSFEKFLKRKKEKENETKRDKDKNKIKDMDRDRIKETEKDRDRIKDKDKDKDRFTDRFTDRDIYRIKDKDRGGDRHRHRHKHRYRDKNRIKDKERKREREEKDRADEMRKEMKQKEKMKKKIKGEGSGEGREQNELEVEKRKEKMKYRERYEHKRDVMESRYNAKRVNYYHEKKSEEKSAFFNGGNRKDTYKNNHREKYNGSDKEKTRKKTLSDKHQEKRHKKYKYNYD